MLLSYHLLQTIMAFQWNLAGFQSPSQLVSPFRHWWVTDSGAVTAQAAQCGHAQTTSYTDVILIRKGLGKSNHSSYLWAKAKLRPC